MNTTILKNLTLADLPASWLKPGHWLPGQRVTVQITVQADSEWNPRTDLKSEVSPIVTQQQRIALMRSIEQQLKGTGSEDSEEWIKWIKETRTVSKPEPMC